MNNRQQTVYALSSRGYYPTSRPSAHPSIVSANKKNIHLPYTRCNEVWKGESEFRDPEAEEFVRESRSLPAKSQMSRSQITNATKNNGDEEGFRGGGQLRVGLRVRREERRLVSRSFHSGGEKIRIQYGVGVDESNKNEGSRHTYEYQQTKKLEIPRTLQQFKSFKSQTLTPSLNPSRNQIRMIRTLAEGAKMESSVHLSDSGSRKGFNADHSGIYEATYDREGSYMGESRITERREGEEEGNGKTDGILKANILYDSRKRTQILKNSNDNLVVSGHSKQPYFIQTPQKESHPSDQPNKRIQIMHPHIILPSNPQTLHHKVPQPHQPAIKTQPPQSQPQPQPQPQPQQVYTSLPSHLQTPHKQITPHHNYESTTAPKSKASDFTPSSTGVTSSFFIKQTTPECSSTSNEYSVSQINSPIHNPQLQQLSRLRLQLAKRDRQLIQHKKQLQNSEKKNKSLQLEIKKLQTDNQISTSNKYALVSYPSHSAYTTMRSSGELVKELGGSVNAFMYMVLFMVLVGREISGK